MPLYKSCSGGDGTVESIGGDGGKEDVLLRYKILRELGAV